MGYLKSFQQTTDHCLIHACSLSSHKNLDSNTSKSPRFILKYKVKLRDSIRWLTKLLPSQDKKTKPCRTPRDNLRVVKTATYLVSFSRLVCLAFLYGWCLLNKVHVYLAWLLTLITQPSLSKLSDDPECTVCSKHIEALTTKQVR